MELILIWPITIQETANGPGSIWAKYTYEIDFVKLTFKYEFI